MGVRLQKSFHVIFGICLLLALFPCGILKAENPPDKPVTPIIIAEPLGDFQSLTIPLKRVGRLFLIEARIGDQTGNFVFDTGASNLVLNRTYFRKDLVPFSEQAGGITGTVEKVYQTRIARLDIGQLYFESVVADVINLGHIENRRGVKILGLFGMCLFRNLEMVIDLRRSELHLYRIDKSGNRINNTRDSLVNDFFCPIKEVGGVLFMQGIMGGKPLDFCLDTGAETNVLSSSASKKVLNTITITRRSELTGSGASQVEVLYGTMNDFSLREHTLHPMKTMITSMSALAQAYNYPLSGVLGYDFFEKGTVCINLVKKELGMHLVQEVLK